MTSILPTTDPLNSPSESSLDNNTACLINNPLKDKSFRQLDREAIAFAKEANASQLLFRKAARLAQDPLDWRSFKKHRELRLEPEEETALEDERDKSFWKQPKYLKVAIANLCFSAIIQGWIQTGLNGANQQWPSEFGLLKGGQGEQAWRGRHSIWIFAIVNAVTFLAASLFGCWLSDPLQGISLPAKSPGGPHKAALGRRGAIFLSCCLLLAALVGSACSHTWRQLLACRAILGLGMGAKASITPIYGAEISPSHLRGAFGMTWQVFDACGILLGFTANAILYQVGPLSWRFQVASASIPTICLMTLCWTVPESPRWLLKQGRIAEAYRSMCFLRETPLQAAREVFYANAQIQVELQLLRGATTEVIPVKEMTSSTHVEDAGADADRDVEQASGDRRATDGIPDASLLRFQEVIRTTKFMYFRRISQLFNNKRTRRATFAAGIVMLAQQLCGVNVLIFYSSTFLRDADGIDASASNAIWLSWGIGWLNFLFTLPAYWAIDKRGRRFLLLTTYPGMILCMLGACLGFLSRNEQVRLGIVGTFMFLFVAFYSVGQGPVAFAYSSEVFPLINREAGMSFAVFVNFFGAGLLTLLVPQAQVTTSNTLGSTFYAHTQAKLLAIFTGFNILAFILIYLFVPETSVAYIPKDEGQLLYLSLEELNWIFGIPVWKHAQHQVTEMLPYHIGMMQWYLTRYFRRMKRPERPPAFYKVVKPGDIEEEWEQEEMTVQGKSSGAAPPSAGPGEGLLAVRPQRQHDISRSTPTLTEE